ncbi:MAG: dCMP deaminase family protein [Lentisphaeria bacterium]|nr:dCMP deaminase family protein [Lentisphaeria bacterium]NQZ69170.1 dCMP deaminase family protein [Lentisphaeria bacterium]
MKLTNEKQLKMDKHFLRLAWVTGMNLSKDPRTKVGAIIVTEDTRQVSIGYNGFPSKLKETPERWEKPLKYDYVIHAELNAIMNCPFDTKGAWLYCTHQPCHRCLEHLVNAGIKRVVYNRVYRSLTHKDIWDEVSNLFDEVLQIDDEQIDKIIAAYGYDDLAY